MSRACLTLGIAQVPLRIVTDDTTAGALAQHYAGFLDVGGRAPAIELTTRRGPAVTHGDEELSVSVTRSLVRVTTPALYDLEVDLRTRRGQLVFADRDMGRWSGPWPFAFHAALKALWPLVMLRHDALMLHASSVDLGRRAGLFVGPSGSGKTTIAHMFGAPAVMNDEFVVLHVDAREVSSTPFFGTPSALRRACTRPLGLAAFLEHGAALEAIPLTRPEALPRLLRCVALPSDAGELVEAALGVAVRALEGDAWRLLRFPLDAEEVVNAVRALGGEIDR